MPGCRITVLKRMFNADLADAYRRPDAPYGPCPFCEEGDQWTVGGAGERPEGFPCDWAWNDIERFVLAMTLGGGFGRWMRDPDTFVACCTDGVKPVVFKLERLDAE